MAYAATHDYIVVTHDLDFSAVLAATQGKKGEQKGGAGEKWPG